MPPLNDHLISLEFEVVEIDETIADDWRLATMSDVEKDLLTARYTLLSENEWVICKLEDGSMKGSGFGFKLDKYYNKGWKYKLIIKKGKK